MAKSVKTDEELPIIESIGLARTSKGYMVVVLTTQGDRFLDRKLLTESPEPFNVARERARIEVIHRIWQRKD